MVIRTFDPYKEKVLAEYKEDSEEIALEKIRTTRREAELYRYDLEARLDYLKNTVKSNLQHNKLEISELMTQEMGKPIKQSIAEVEKCIKLVDYAIENLEKFYAIEDIKTEARRSYVRFDPIGVVLAIMPWNFPLWQVMRAAIPAISAGNGVILKHASITTGTAHKIKELFDSDLLNILIVSGSNALKYIPYVDGVTFTGSTGVGANIAQEAGKNIKKVVLELGGSDPFIVLKSADIREAAKQGALGRLQNNGQSCIASKRFLVHSDIYNEFQKALSEEFSGIIQGDPMDNSTYLGPLSSQEQKNTVTNQIEELKSLGANVTSSEKKFKQIFPPTIATINKRISYDQEIFGPVALIEKFDTNEEAVKIANGTTFGLGASVWGDNDEAEQLVPKIEAGMVFINKIVTSDPRMPFGGVKRSGFGRELSRYGFLEFTNIKSVWIEH